MDKNNFLEDKELLNICMIFAKSDDYHFYLSSVKWALYRKYTNSKIYLSKDNDNIMDSDHNSIEELREFVKKHKKIDEFKIMMGLRTVLNVILMLLVFFNAFVLKIKFLSLCFILFQIILLLEQFMQYFLWKHNFAIKKVQFKEDLLNYEMYK